MPFDEILAKIEGVVSGEQRGFAGGQHLFCFQNPRTLLVFSLHADKKHVQGRNYFSGQLVREEITLTYETKERISTCADQGIVLEKKLLFWEKNTTRFRDFAHHSLKVYQKTKTPLLLVETTCFTKHRDLSRFLRTGKTVENLFYQLQYLFEKYLYCICSELALNPFFTVDYKFANILVTEDLSLKLTDIWGDTHFCRPVNDHPVAFTNFLQQCFLQPTLLRQTATALVLVTLLNSIHIFRGKTNNKNECLYCLLIQEFVSFSQKFSFNTKLIFLLEPSHSSRRTILQLLQFYSPHCSRVSPTESWFHKNYQVTLTCPLHLMTCISLPPLKRKACRKVCLNRSLLVAYYLGALWVLFRFGKMLHKKKFCASLCRYLILAKTYGI